MQVKSEEVMLLSTAAQVYGLFRVPCWNCKGSTSSSSSNPVPASYSAFTLKWLVSHANCVFTAESEGKYIVPSCNKVYQLKLLLIIFKFIFFRTLVLFYLCVSQQISKIMFGDTSLYQLCRVCSNLLS